MDPAPEMMVTPKVRLVRKLGEGGMGSVWVAEHLGLATKVAVKFTAPDLVRRRPELLERFRREAAIAARIKSPHVVQVFDHGLTEDGAPYIVMELLEGESLGRRLRREHTLGLKLTALAVSQVAQVLGRAHKLGIVHRDIKPANLFLMRSDYELFVKVLDFGIAKLANLLGEVSATASGTVMGSPLYMSPEQFMSARDVDGRADLWSLAVVAFQALCGRPPFPGESMGQVMMAAVDRQSYRAPSEMDPALPAAFDGWFAKAFAPDITERFQSADELGRSFVGLANEALGSSSAVSQISMPPMSPAQDDVEPASETFAPAASTVQEPWNLRLRKRRVLVLGALGVGLLTLGGLGALGLRSLGHPSEPTAGSSAPLPGASSPSALVAPTGAPSGAPQGPSAPPRGGESAAASSSGGEAPSSAVGAPADSARAGRVTVPVAKASASTRDQTTAPPKKKEHDYGF